MKEKKLVENYYVSKWAMEQAQGQIEEHFLGLAKKAIKAGNGSKVLDIMSRCPSPEVENKIAELLNKS